MKQCTLCDQVKPVDAFSPDSRKPGRRLAACKDCRAKGAQQWRDTNVERSRSGRRERHAANRDRELADMRDRAASQRLAVFAHYGTRCGECSSTDRLQLDHVHGNGAEHRAACGLGHRGGGPAFYAWLLRNDFPAECEPGGRFELQVLCLDCHARKTAMEKREVAV